MEFLADPPLCLSGTAFHIVHSSDEVTLLVGAKYKMIEEFGFYNAQEYQSIIINTKPLILFYRGGVFGCLLSANMTGSILQLPLQQK